MTTELSFKELLDYTELEVQRWHAWFQKNPGALDVKLDNVALAKDIRHLVQHIVAVDLRYSERLHDEAITPYEAISTESADAMFAVQYRALEKLRAFLGSATEADWKTQVEFPTRVFGTLAGSRRKIFVHTLLHGMRHWAQAASALRSAGFPQDWQHDLIFSEAME